MGETQGRLGEETSGRWSKEDGKMTGRHRREGGSRDKSDRCEGERGRTGFGTCDAIWTHASASAKGGEEYMRGRKEDEDERLRCVRVDHVTVSLVPDRRRDRGRPDFTR